MNYNYSSLLKRLEKPTKPVDVVIDTDTYNEIDDQYALAYLIRSNDKLNLKAIYAAPFFNEHSKSPKDGMEKSYEEIMNILTLMKEDKYKDVTFKGSNDYLKSETEPVDSEAVNHLINLSKNYSEDNPLYVIAIGAITNIASGIIIDPTIINRIVVVWLGGHSSDWCDSMEFNMCQDVAAARVVMGSYVPFVMLPCMGVVSSFYTTAPELTYWLKGKNKLCDYLLDLSIKEGSNGDPNRLWSRVIWDVTAVAWLLNEDFMLDRIEPTFIPQYDHHYSYDPRRHPMKYVYHINRDLLFKDLFDKLAK